MSSSASQARKTPDLPKIASPFRSENEEEALETTSQKKYICSLENVFRVQKSRPKNTAEMQQGEHESREKPKKRSKKTMKARLVDQVESNTQSSREEDLRSCTVMGAVCEKAFISDEPAKLKKNNNLSLQGDPFAAENDMLDASDTIFDVASDFADIIFRPIEEANQKSLEKA
ncbi:hypothetical protein KIN20_016432 [Parelaphostrongylus tenuis]|uniref:Uncharacterized protein n=1 Tax=Parelaphostrongylus tenuis TaxID=148309 RepID=A0AAD5MK10_PARTN|nr:hypothetical protein KIN20_016432 [Parelaphostrongylus tenuis]